MKAKNLILIAIMLILLFGCTNTNNQDYQKPSDNVESKIMVVYFSCTNTTTLIAQKIANYLHCKKEEIVPLTPYSSDDLNYNKASSRTNMESNDATSRPEIKKAINLENVNTIFLGYPIWYGKLPKIIYTFLETYKWDSCTIIPFCTSGSSGISTSVSEIRHLVPNASVLDGQRFASNASDQDIKKFVDGLKLA